MEDVIIIRPYQPKDKEQVLALILDIQTSEFAIEITAEQQPDLQDIPNFYQIGNGNFWTAVVFNALKDSEQIVGTVSLLDIGNQQAALRKMFVAKAFRGASYGTASQLLETALKWQKEKGISQVFLGTTAKFLAAHRFYEKNGFKSISKSELPSSFPVMTVDTRFYVYPE
ncbi:GNAT family N-acetyltransferase [Litoribacillus peritrichatus]|uniref:GNAT family N-acetyltransferase n=1 Tax=Litoribacillus peritrichatus TaxID=718191 RepID=A0ABP7MVX0_9GAMM